MEFPFLASLEEASAHLHHVPEPVADGAISSTTISESSSTANVARIESISKHKCGMSGQV